VENESSWLEKKAEFTSRCCGFGGWKRCTVALHELLALCRFMTDTEQIRLYSISEKGVLLEDSPSHLQSGDWESGPLTAMGIKPAEGSALAATAWTDKNDQIQIRLYYQGEIFKIEC
jgi:hypothetical protein